MKILICAIALFSIQLISNAQVADSTSKCYDEYKTLFAKRGVYALKDGVYNTVITFRLNGVCTAYPGQARIEGGKFMLPLYIKNDEGEFVTIKSTGRNINPHYDAYKIPLENKVVNGMSPTYITDADELGDVFIVDLLKPEVK